MKALRIIIVVLLFQAAYHCGANGQTTDNISLFAEENTTWCSANFSGMTGYPSESYYQKLEGDTVINDIHYHILKLSDVSFEESENEYIYLFLRVDEDSVLYYRNLQGVEREVFDYTLQEGDPFSFFAFNTYSGSFYYVSGYVIYTGVQNYFGAPRKVWGLSNYEDVTDPEYKWIQGIGPLDGPASANNSLSGYVGTYYELLCCWLNEVEIYHNAAYPLCYYGNESPNIAYLCRFYMYWNVGVFNADHSPITTRYLGWQDWYYNFNTGMNYAPLSSSNQTFLLARVDANYHCLVRLPSNPTEYLLFDFSMAPGDTGTFYAYNSDNNQFTPVFATLTDTNYVETLTGMRKSWNLTSEGGYSTRWIKGLGPEESMFYPNRNLLGEAETYSAVLCIVVALDDLEYVYDNPLYDGCTVNTEIEIYAKNVSIYPNPCTEFINIEIDPADLPAQLMLYDVSGKILIQQVLNHSNTSVNTASLSQGMYFYKLISKSGSVCSGKLIK